MYKISTYINVNKEHIVYFNLLIEDHQENTSVSAQEATFETIQLPKRNAQVSLLGPPSAIVNFPSAWRHFVWECLTVQLRGRLARGAIIRTNRF